MRVAARSGQVIGFLIAGLGLMQLFFVAGGLIGGLWFLFIGWFLAGAAQSEMVQHDVAERLRGLTVMMGGPARGGSDPRTDEPRRVFFKRSVDRLRAGRQNTRSRSGGVTS